jgi:hypothetical protein
MLLLKEFRWKQAIFAFDLPFTTIQKSSKFIAKNTGSVFRQLFKLRSTCFWIDHCNFVLNNKNFTTLITLCLLAYIIHSLAHNAKGTYFINIVIYIWFFVPWIFKHSLTILLLYRYLTIFNNGNYYRWKDTISCIYFSTLNVRCLQDF